ncbi:hypothetical protein HZB03_05490 [Candidatus Woesearchaeota archaeon]|nr:hypothetical protein [Candidatus Woesearchaeota archaeon]
MAEETQIQQPQVRATAPQSKQSEKWNPFMLRRFVTHLSVAAKKYESKSAAREELQTKLQQIRQLALNKRSKKNHVVEVFADFEQKLLSIMKDEKVLLEEQRKETHELNSLRTQVAELNAKLIELGKEYAKELEEKEMKLMQLKENLASLHIRMSEDTTSPQPASEKKFYRQKRVGEIALRAEGAATEAASPIIQLEAQLAALEQKHKEFAKSGKHSKEDLARVKKIIDAHKKKILELKK